MSLSLDIVSVFLALLAVVFAFFKWRYGYWKRRGLPYLEPTIPFGNCKETILQQCSFNEQFAKLYFEIKEKGLKHAGVYFAIKPMYVPVDEELVKHILQKDFEHFTDRGFYANKEHDPLSAHLFSLDGPMWRNLRIKLSPTFTSGKMKMMFKILDECTKGLQPILQESARNNIPLDIKDTMARFTTDVISSCAFGLDTSCLKDPDNEFRKYGKKIFEVGSLEAVKGLLQFALPHWLLKKLGVRSSKKDVEQFFLNIVKKNIDFRRKNNVSRSDFFQLLLQLQDSDPSFGFEELAAQAFVFFAAGYETSSTATMFTLLELCQNIEIQDKLRNEVHKVLAAHNNEISYDAVMDMTYMDQVLNEAMRIHPPLPFLIRQCSKDFKIPGTEVILEKGIQAVIPLLGFQLDPEHFPNPKVFDPERFSPENKNNRSGMLHMPFGDGPRNCIGLRFGLMQSKVGLVTFLKNYRFTLNKKTILPLKINPRVIIHTPMQSIWLNVEQI